VYLCRCCTTLYSCWQQSNTNGKRGATLTKYAVNNSGNIYNGCIICISWKRSCNLKYMHQSYVYKSIKDKESNHVTTCIACIIYVKERKWLTCYYRFNPLSWLCKSIWNNDDTLFFKTDFYRFVATAYAIRLLLAT